MFIKDSEYVFDLTVTDLETNKEVFNKYYSTLEEINLVLDSNTIDEPFESLIELAVCEKVNDNLIFLFGKELDMIFPLDHEEIEDLRNELTRVSSPGNVNLTPTYQINTSEIQNYDPKISKKDLDQFKYVCPHCWNTIDKCVCHSYPYFLIQIDNNILPIIKILNMKKYYTSSSCEGHIDQEYTNVYIVFRDYYSFPISFPKGGHFSSNAVLTYEIYGKTNEERNKSKNKILKELYQWAKSL